LKDKQHKGSGTPHQGANGLSSTPADSTLIKHCPSLKIHFDHSLIDALLILQPDLMLTILKLSQTL